MGITAKAAVGGGAVTEFWEVTLWTLWGGELTDPAGFGEGVSEVPGSSVH